MFVRLRSFDSIVFTENIISFIQRNINRRIICLLISVISIQRYLTVKLLRLFKKRSFCSHGKGDIAAADA